MAQSAPVTTEYGEHHPYVEGFDGYLDQHPEVREQLSHDPHLIDDPAYMANHPELRDYMHERDIVVAGRPLPEGASIAASRHGTASRGQ